MASYFYDNGEYKLVEHNQKAIDLKKLKNKMALLKKIAEQA